MHPPEVLQADPLTLRRWELTWADQLVESIRESLPELQEFMPWANADYGLDQAREFIERSREEWEAGQTWNYAMWSPAGDLVGANGLMTRMGPGVLEIGYWIDSRYSGRGYTTAAAGALAEVGLRVPDIERLIVKADVANLASNRIPDKLGFVRIGTEAVEPSSTGETGVLAVWERRPTS
jgi:ribosomal-protein-serine acetyltransferase